MNAVFKQLILKSKNFVTKNSPIILTVTAAVGVVSAVVITAKVAPTAKEIIDDTKKQLDVVESSEVLSEEEKKEEKKQIIFECSKECAPLIAPPVIVTGMTIGAIILSHKVNLRRQIALATACDISNKALEEYQAKTKASLGERNEKLKIRDEIAGDYISNHPPVESEIISTGKGDTLCFDPKSGRYFKSSPEFIKKVEAQLNKKIFTLNYQSLNDFYYELGLETIDLGDDIGWNVMDSFLDLDFSSRVTDNDQPCLVLMYDVYARHDYRDI